MRGLISILSRAKATVRHWQAARRSRELVGALFPDEPSVRVLASTGDVAVLRVDRLSRPSQILKMARTTSACEQLEAEIAALDELALFGHLGFEVATVRDQGTYAGGTWFTQSFVEGESTEQVSLPLTDMTTAAVSAMSALHRQTAEPMTIEHVAALVDVPLETIKSYRSAAACDLDAIAAATLAELDQKQCTVSRLHGDYAPSNVLWDARRASVSGVVDWTLDRDSLLPEIDLVNFALALIMQRSGEQLGDVLRRCRAGSLDSEAHAALQAAVAGGPNGLTLSTAVTLAWMHHVAVGLTKQEQLRKNHLWLRSNIDQAVTALSGRNFGCVADDTAEFTI